MCKITRLFIVWIFLTINGKMQNYIRMDVQQQPMAIPFDC